MTVSTERAKSSVTVKQREVFLEALASGWSVTKAATLAGTARQRMYEQRDQDEAFAAAWVEAVEVGTQMLEDELRRRGLEGYDEETFDGAGKLIRRVRRLSPQDLITSLKARRPEVYRDNQRVELTGADGGPLEVTSPDVAAALERFNTNIDRLIARAESGGAVRALDAGRPELASGGDGG